MSKGDNEKETQTEAATGPSPRKGRLPRAGVIGGILSAVALVAAGGGLVSAGTSGLER